MAIFLIRFHLQMTPKTRIISEKLRVSQRASITCVYIGHSLSQIFLMEWLLDLA